MLVKGATKLHLGQPVIVQNQIPRMDFSRSHTHTSLIPIIKEENAKENKKNVSPHW